MTKCYIFDIDGTLANCDHRLHHIKQEPKDWYSWHAKTGGDAPYSHIVRLAQDLFLAGTMIIFVTGRSEECREATRDWLDQHGLIGPIYMRPDGDHRDDNVLKIELLGRARRDGFDPIMVFDDRSRVVAAWREAGVPCAQVAQGDY